MDYRRNCEKKLMNAVIVNEKIIKKMYVKINKCKYLTITYLFLK